MKLSETLFELRRRAGLSQEELAERIGVSRQAVGKWENGTSVPELEKLLALSEFYNVPIGELLGVEAPAEAPETPDAPVEAPPPAPDTGALEELLRGLGERQREAEQRSRRQRRCLWGALAAAVAAIAVVTVVLGVKMVDLRRRLSNLNSLVVFTQNSLQNSIVGLRNSVTGLLEAQDALFTSWDYTQEYDPESGMIRLTITAAPKTVTEGVAVTFTARRGEEVYTADAPLQNGVCTAQMLIPVEPSQEDQGLRLQEALNKAEAAGNEGAADWYGMAYSAYGDWRVPDITELELYASVNDGETAVQRDLGTVYVSLSQTVEPRSANWYMGGVTDTGATGLLTVLGAEGSVSSARLVVCTDERQLYSRELELDWDGHFTLPEAYAQGPTYWSGGIKVTLARPGGDLGERYYIDLSLDFAGAQPGERVAALLELTDDRGITYVGLIFAYRLGGMENTLARDAQRTLDPVVRAGD